MPNSPRGVLLWLVAGLACLSAVFVALAVLGHSPVPVWRLIALLIGAHLPFAAVMLLAWRRWIPGGPWTVIGAALALRLILVCSPPVFSDDIYRYVWDGRVLQAGHNPFAFAPDDPALESQRNDEWARINNPALRTIYPPLAQTVFVATAAVWPRVSGFKLVSALFDTSVVLLVFALAGGRLTRRRSEVDRAGSDRAILAGMFYGLNPLTCVESGMSGHLEPIALAPTLLAVVLLTRGKDSSGGGSRLRDRASTWLAAASLGLAWAVKLVPALLWPALGRRNWRVWVVAPLVVAALYLPFASAGSHLFESMGTFARSWEGNAGIFALLKALAEQVVGWIAGVERPDEIVHATWLDGPARALEGTFFTLHRDSTFDPSAPGAFTLGDLALAVAKLVAGAALIAILVVTLKRRFEPVRAGLWLFGALLLVSPVVHPWYILWVLPFAAVRRAWPWLVLGALLPLAYLPLDGWWSQGVWSAPGWIPWIEYGAFFVALAVDRFSRSL
jgi:hypothetical protein